MIKIGNKPSVSVDESLFLRQFLEYVQYLQNTHTYVKIALNSTYCLGQVHKFAARAKVAFILFA